MARVFALTVSLMVSACAAIPPTPASAPQNGSLISIRNESLPFCGRCESATITVTSDGRVWVDQGHYQSLYEDWKVRRYLINISPSTHAEFVAALSSIRPVGNFRRDESRACGTDQGGLLLSWDDKKGKDSYYFDFGCDDPQNASTIRSIRSAVAVLGIQKSRLSWGLTGA